MERRDVLMSFNWLKLLSHSQEVRAPDVRLYTQSDLALPDQIFEGGVRQRQTVRTYVHRARAHAYDTYVCLELVPRPYGGNENFRGAHNATTDSKGVSAGNGGNPSGSATECYNNCNRGIHCHDDNLTLSPLVLV